MTQDRDGRVAEVVAASISAFTAQTYALHGEPPLGSLIRVASDGDTILAVVADVRRGSLDPGRSVQARGADEESEESVYRNNPELATLLRTEIVARIVGVRLGGGPVLQRQPAYPPRLHAFVYRCDAEEVRLFGDRLDFLGPLVASGGQSADDLVGAVLRGLARERPDPRTYLVAAGKRLIALLQHDSVRLANLLRTAER